MRTLARKAANFRGLADPPGSTCSLSFEHTELASTRSGSPGLEQGAQGWSGQPADSGLEQGAQGWKGSLPADSSLERGAQGWKGSWPGAQAGRGPPSCYARRGQAARAMRPVMLRRSADTFLMGIL